MKEKVLNDLANGSTKSFYNSSEWKSKRLEILERDHNDCQRCLMKFKGKGPPKKKFELVRATEVHHIIELKDDPSLALDDNNLISLCHHCHDIQHDRITKWFNRNKKKVEDKGIETDERW